MIAEIEKAKKRGDSLGGVIGIWADNVPVGLGSCMHFDQRLDAKIAAALMSIPLVKAVSIGAYSVAAGLPTHVGVMLPVLGSPLVTEVLTSKVKDLTGGYFIVDLDPESAADELLAAIDERRKGLGL